MVTITLDADYGYVFLSICATAVVSLILGVRVSKARKRCGISYPSNYANAKEHGAKEAFEFNCYQRGHHNMLEGVGTVRIMTLFVGLFNPFWAAACCLAYAVGRLVYGVMYGSGGPDKRLLGSLISHLGDLPLLVMGIFYGLRLAGLIA